MQREIFGGGCRHLIPHRQATAAGGNTAHDKAPAILHGAEIRQRDGGPGRRAGTRGIRQQIGIERDCVRLLHQQQQSHRGRRRERGKRGGDQGESGIRPVEITRGKVVPVRLVRLIQGALRNPGATDVAGNKMVPFQVDAQG